MNGSINTNYGAQIALQNLNATSKALQTTQNRISTGLKISTAKDNGAIWAIAQTQRNQNSALDAVKDSLNNGKSVIDTTISAGTQLTDLLTQMKQKSLAASDAGVTDTTRSQYQAEFNKLAQTYSNVIASASFNGTNQIDSGTTLVKALGSADGKVTVSSAHTKLDAATVFGATGVFTVTAGTGGAPDTVAAGTTWADGAGTAAATAMAKIDAALTTVTGAMSGFGVDSKAMDNQLTLVSNLQDSLTAGVGNLVDADVAKESANLTALQTKQQLGVQALSIANSSSSVLLSLFR